MYISSYEGLWKFVLSSVSSTSNSESITCSSFPSGNAARKHFPDRKNEDIGFNFRSNIRSCCTQFDSENEPNHIYLEKEAKHTYGFSFFAFKLQITADSYIAQKREKSVTVIFFRLFLKLKRSV